MASYTWTVDNATSYKGDMIVRQYSSFNLSAGNTLTPDNRAQGVMIFVDGNATIDGTITVYGAYNGTPADLSWNMIWAKAGETDTLNNSSTEWGNGSSASNGVQSDLATILNKMPNISSGGKTVFTGSNGSGNATGGTGWGGGAPNSSQAGNNIGSPFSGGAGNGAEIGLGNNGAGTTYGGQGGDGYSGGAYPLGAGAGNPSGSANAGQNFAGGLFVMCASGNIAGSGTIDCSGGNGGYASFGGVEALYAYGGGGAGGGRIILIAGGTISGSITCDVAGGSGGGAVGSKNNSINGSAGNNGTVTQVAGVRT